jgi:rhodanese-related sulfurtransferase
MTSPFFRSLILACLLAACSSSGGGPSADAPSGTRDTTGLVADCISSACTSAVSTDATTEGTDTADAPPLAPDGRADTPGPDGPNPDAQTPDVVVRKEDVAVPDLSDATLTDTWLPDLTDAVPAKTDTWLPDLTDAVPAKTDTSLPDTRADTAGPDNATCAQEPFVHLTPLELKTLLDGGEDPFLINVKGSSIKNIPGTDAVLASDVPGIEALVKNDLCANIVLYCRSGATSQTVGSQLIAKGYRRVRDLAGGITAWEAAGYPTE